MVNHCEEMNNCDCFQHSASLNEIFLAAEEKTRPTEIATVPEAVATMETRSAKPKFKEFS